jgi:HPt (histidine-containing phosphotransfer) domain-containing protein
MFVSDTRELLQECVQASKKRDRTKLGSAAHKLKGGCKMIYAEPMAEDCARIESLIENNNWTEIEKELARLQEHFFCTCNTLQSTVLTHR